MHDLLQLGAFPPHFQELIDAGFRCHSLEQVERDDALRGSLRGIIARSNSEVPAALIARMPSLGVISTFGVGYERIPLALARERGIAVSNTPDVLNAAVAELGVGLVLAMLRQLPQVDRFVRAGRWPEAAFPLGVSLAGKRVGIAGLGRIGKEIALRLEPFGVSLSYYGRHDQGLAWPHVPDLLSLAANCDILISMLPGGAGTEKIIDRAVLEALGPQGYLVNVGRGSVVNEEDLIDALGRKAIAGAALDVFDKEPDIDQRLFALDNVVLTSHIGSATHETRMAMLRLTLDNLRSYFDTGAVLTPVL
ncbi:2-hydroxyacid dehydrogenase [Pseudoduganella namucuonensis]|uniref:Lactate dehydrogenase n=1 Tax=Pseudoduganella namucuonensis TaxID=1035707 RepID=A0A1I7KS02_9BURK|nr:2-hydroxyacid dehydrogenase [Pseudoduganella namucuonensis]SFV00136.1 Lactate dehydrogenase [Pseudoduganella namucuonensis]